MRLTRIAFLIVVVASAWSGLQPAYAQDIAIPDGVVAKEIDPPVPSAIPGSHDKRVLVMEIFDYACSHCRAFQPMFDKWAMQQADDVDILQLPYLLGSSLDSNLQLLSGRAYIALMIMGRNGYPTQSLLAHRQFFDEILPFYQHMTKSDPPGTYKDMVEFMAAQVAREGMGKDEFKKIFFSHEVDEAVKSIQQAEKSFDVPGIPAIVVNGKYYVAPDPWDTKTPTDEVYNGMLKLTGQLAAREP
ncbi:thioredoxin domain-containing protein [Stakelama marina]|uniref:Thioredoxin domain-containing protein n=1 Tax=Stakelama marina TaxID=2826939 RepID=A0A8T4I9S1_9SPHN|nr:thioredoxin domain-containing protein [Stakelama marina]MBR0550882.1 thioredoxin domain-containing protein [Stakelama marina]